MLDRDTVIKRAADNLTRICNLSNAIEEVISSKDHVLVGSAVYKALWGINKNIRHICTNYDFLVWDRPDVTKVMAAFTSVGLTPQGISSSYGGSALQITLAGELTVDVVYAPAMSWDCLNEFTIRTPLTHQAVFFSEVSYRRGVSASLSLQGPGIDDAMAGQFRINPTGDFKPSVQYPTVESYAAAIAARTGFKWLDSTPEKHKCRCDIVTLMGRGCKCGGI